VFRGNELRANLFEIEVSEVDGISNEIKFLLPFTLFKTVHCIPDYSWEIHAISLTIKSERDINLSYFEKQETPL
jgi:hypothetical protein